MKANQLVPLLLCAALAACAQQPRKQDPLQNTRKLAAEGAATLYHNGAFEIPMTTIHIIPPGPDAVDLAGEMFGLRARQSFQESVKHARESVDLARAGIGVSVEAAQATRQATGEAAQGARSVTRFGMDMARSAPGVTYDMVGASVTFAGDAYRLATQAGSQLANDSVAAGKEMSVETDSASMALGAGTLAMAGATSSESWASARAHASSALRFIKGWAAVPGKLGQRAAAAKEGTGASLSNFVAAFQRSNEWRAEQSANMHAILVDTKQSYAKGVGDSLSAAKREIDQGSAETGYTLALLKSLGWVVQGVFWDATIKPAGKMAGASLGYLAANGVAFPALIIEQGGVAVADVAVQVTWNSAAAAYDVTAPTGAAALAGVFSAVELVGGQTLAGGELAAGAVATAGTYAGGQLAAFTTAGGGYLAGKTVQYVGAPLSTLGVGAGGTAVGLVTGTATAVAGTGLTVGGAAGELATRVAGNTGAITVGAGGVVTSVAAGAALGTYELSRAVVVPTGYRVGSAVVLGYGTVSQLSAQTVLAVADASYMVLSLEGPNWVLYAIRGDLGKGDDLAPGAILDLKAMQKAGETIVAVPASPEEMKRVVDAVPAQLPVREGGASPATGVARASSQE